MNSLTNCNPMVVEYVRILYSGDELLASIGPNLEDVGPKPGEVKEFKQIGVTFCCPNMFHAFRSGIVGFGTRKAEILHNKAAEVFLRTRPSTQANTYDTPIPYCPWCTQPVTTREIGTVS